MCELEVIYSKPVGKGVTVGDTFLCNVDDDKYIKNFKLTVEVE